MLPISAYVCNIFWNYQNSWRSIDPRACVDSFFSPNKLDKAEYAEAFENELRAFETRVRNRAAEKIVDALKEAGLEEKKTRLGPGGLDPVEVFESLPEVKMNSLYMCLFTICKYCYIDLSLSAFAKMFRNTRYPFATSNTSCNA